jgi:folate-binding Fe-S cluster repair protein YgfZ
MANLHSLGGISFTKGCYTGQEVVARMHYLGKLKRRMYRAHIDVDTPPPPGEPIYNAGAGTDNSAGKVVLAQPAPQGGVDLLAVLQISSVEAGPLHLGQPDGPLLNLLDLPYEVANEA